MRLPFAAMTIKGDYRVLLCHFGSSNVIRLFRGESLPVNLQNVNRCVMQVNFKLFTLFSFCFAFVCFIYYKDIAYVLILAGLFLIVFSDNIVNSFGNGKFTVFESESRTHSDQQNSVIFRTNNFLNGYRNHFLSDSFTDNIALGAHTDSTMWTKRERNTPSKLVRQSGSAKTNPLNSTMPILGSPLARRTDVLNSSLNYSLSASPNRRQNNENHPRKPGPLSSPFMPQIKRALGLEPTNQHKYRYKERINLFNI